jgi:hypothetical protein
MLLALVPVFLIMNGGSGNWGFLYLLVILFGVGIFQLIEDWL